MSAAVSRITSRGLEDLLRYVRGEAAPPPMVGLLGLVMEDAEYGRVTFSAIPTEGHYNGLGTVHGGFLATLADTAMGCAVHSTLEGNALYTTTDLSVSFVRPVTKTTGKIFCQAEVLHVGKRLATAEARIVDERGVLYAHAKTSCMVLGPFGTSIPA